MTCTNSNASEKTIGVENKSCVRHILMLPLPSSYRLKYCLCFFRIVGLPHLLLFIAEWLRLIHALILYWVTVAVENWISVDIFRSQWLQRPSSVSYLMIGFQIVQCASFLNTLAIRDHVKIFYALKRNISMLNTYFSWRHKIYKILSVDDF